MKLEDFRSGTYKQQYQYRSFTPALINHPWRWDDPIINTMLEDAMRWLGELNAYSKILPDVDMYIKMHVLKEANASSRIEGTQTRMETAAREYDQVEPEQRDDWQEVQNYVRAMNQAIERLQTLPLSNRLLNDTHRILMEGVRGEGKTPGEMRKSQNWIGGSSLKDAVFIPPHHEDVPDLMSDLELFWHNDSIEVPHLIRLAISHYQFETIHPYQDGNGRIGRLLITLYLVSEDLLHRPCLYVSAFLEKHRGSYYDALTRVRESHDVRHWVKFFLSAVTETSQGATETFRQIVELRSRLEERILQLGRKAENARRMLDLMYTRPTVTVGWLDEHMDLSYKAVNELVSDFVKLGILTEVTGHKRNRIFYFVEYFNLFLA